MAAVTSPIFDFGEQASGTISTKTFTIRNTSSAPLDLDNAVVTGDHAADFTMVSTGMATSILAGAQTTFTVSFSPSHAGIRSSKLQIFSNAANETLVEITLTGSAPVQRPGIAISNDYDDPIGGGVIAWGYQDQSSVPAAARSDVQMVAGSLYHSLALKTDGSVIAWGSLISTEPVRVLVQNGVVAISDSGTFALKGDGSVIAWGENSIGQTSRR